MKLSALTLTLLCISLSLICTQIVLIGGLYWASTLVEDIKNSTRYVAESTNFIAMTLISDKKLGSNPNIFDEQISSYLQNAASAHSTLTTLSKVAVCSADGKTCADVLEKATDRFNNELAVTR